jgi:hypothetical protein
MTALNSLWKAFRSKIDQHRGRVAAAHIAASTIDWMVDDDDDEARIGERGRRVVLTEKMSAKTMRDHDERQPHPRA